MGILIVSDMHKLAHLIYCISSITNRCHVYSLLECTTNVFINTCTCCQLDINTCMAIEMNISINQCYPE